MFKGLCLLLLLFTVIPTHVNAQILPKEGSSLNYRIIGFSFPASKLPKGNSWKIEIARGDYSDPEYFKENIIHITYLHKNKVIIEVPAFGRQYTWRVVYTDNPTTEQLSVLHHFSTAIIPNLDTNLIRLRVLKKTYKYKDCFVFLDGLRIMYNMKGQPVWFLPKADTFDGVNRVAFDLKITRQGTLTFLTNFDAGNSLYEVNYNGKILWKMQGNISGFSEHYHHEFTRLGNGHYMVLSSEFLPTDSIGNNLASARPDAKIEFGKLIEYDKNGVEVWSWKSSAFYMKMWLQHKEDKVNDYNDVHANAFFFDEKTQYAYISFKNINQIVKVKYPEGNVVDVYGAPNANSPGEIIFCSQHACKISQEGYLYLFNNNKCHPDAAPQLIMFQEPQSVKTGLKKVWAYEYPVVVEREAMHKGSPARMGTVGGNVIELPDHSIFASLCNPYGNIFIVDRKKRLLWDAVPERMNESQKKWEPFPVYRASIIKNQQELEKLVWHNEQKT